MAIEDHPKYQEWLNSFDHLTAAIKRHGEALLSKSPHLDANKIDMEKAQKVYDEVCEDLD